MAVGEVEAITFISFLGTGYRYKLVYNNIYYICDKCTYCLSVCPLLWHADLEC